MFLKRLFKMKSSDDTTELFSSHRVTSLIQCIKYPTMADVESNPNSSINSNNVISSSNSSNNNNKLSNDVITIRETCTVNNPIEANTFYNVYQSLVDSLRSLDEGKEFVCGWGAALVNITITFPINKIIFRQMLHNVRVGSAYEQIRSEGIMFLYRGVLPPLLQKSVSTSLMFGMYEECRKPLCNMNMPVVVGNATAAMLAGSFEAILTPFERLQTLLQDQYYHKEFRNTTHALKIISAEYGFKEFYRGFVPIVLRNGPSNVLFFGLRDYCNDTIPDSQLWCVQMMKQFLIGACIGTLISSVFYPFNVVKVHVQSRLGGPYQSVSDAFREVFSERNRSLRKFYRGVYMNCTRSFISWGVINVSYEAIKNLLYRS